MLSRILFHEILFGELGRELGEPGSGAGGTRAPGHGKELHKRARSWGNRGGAPGGPIPLDNKSKNPSKQSLVREICNILIYK